jgi:hypothetical protein
MTQNTGYLWPDDDALASKPLGKWDYIHIWKVNKSVVLTEYLIYLVDPDISVHFFGCVSDHYYSYQKRKSPVYFL